MTFSSLEQLLDEHSYQTLFLDAYGVFWSGNAQGAFPNAQTLMTKLFSSNKKIAIISNSTQLSVREIEKYKKHGFIQGTHFHSLTTSGDIAKQIFSDEQLPFPIHNKKYTLFSPPTPKYASPSALFEGSSFAETSDPKEADFIYINVPHIDEEDQEEVTRFEDMVQSFLQYNKPMMCANPDRFAHEGMPPRPVVRQGSIATLYEKMGGSVFYIGKPSSQIYLHALKELQAAKEEVLMVGDTPETDIRGARLFGIHSALITQTGIMGERMKEKNGLEILPETDSPDYLIERFAHV